MFHLHSYVLNGAVSIFCYIEDWGEDWEEKRTHYLHKGEHSHEGS